MNINSSHKFTRSGNTAYGCIDGVNLEEYQVGVVEVVDVPQEGKYEFHLDWGGGSPDSPSPKKC
jgi:hypothetical protein